MSFFVERRRDNWQRNFARALPRQQKKVPLLPPLSNPSYISYMSTGGPPPRQNHPLLLFQQLRRKRRRIGVPKCHNSCWPLSPSCNLRLAPLFPPATDRAPADKTCMAHNHPKTHHAREAWRWGQAPPKKDLSSKVEEKGEGGSEPSVGPFPPLPLFYTFQANQQHRGRAGQQYTNQTRVT